MATWFSTTVTWSQRCTGALSALGSAAIIYIILSDRKRKLQKPKNRLMFFMSLFDIIQSLAFILSSASILYPGLCQFQGICIWLGVAVPLYNSSLNVFYMLSIRYNMDSHYFSNRIEPFLHAVSILYPVSIAISFTLLGYIKPIGGLCWSGGMPAGLGWGIPVFLCFLFSVFSMGSIYRAVMKQENDMRRHRFGVTQENQNTELKETRTQALLYTSAFFITYVFPMIEGVVPENFSYTARRILVVFTTTFYPLQGFWNFVFYIRPGLKYVRKVNPEMSLFKALREVIFNAHGVANSFRNRSQLQTRSSRSRFCSSPNSQRPPSITSNRTFESKNTADDGNNSNNNPPKIQTRRVSFAPISQNDQFLPIASSDDIAGVSPITSEDEISVDCTAVDGKDIEANPERVYHRRESFSCMSSFLSSDVIDAIENDPVPTPTRRSSIVSIQSLGSMIGL